MPSQPEQWWAVFNADGSLYSEGSVVANPLPEGRTKAKVDGPSNGRPWDAQAKAWGDPPPSAPEPLDPGAVLAIAQDADLTPQQRLDAIVHLAQ